MTNAAHLHQDSSALSRSPAGLWLENFIYVLLLGMALAAPLWTKAAVLLLRVALVLWIAALLSSRRRLPKIGLALPMLAYLLLALISTLFSPLPALSWGRMRTETLLLAAPLAAWGLRTAQRRKWAIYAVMASTLFGAAYTGWQFARGIGVRIATPLPAELSAAGLQQEDVIASVDGAAVRGRASWMRALANLHAQSISLGILRGDPPKPLQIRVQRTALLNLGTESAIPVERARPQRAEAFFSNYIPYSELLLLAAIVACGLLISAAATRNMRASVVWGVIFFAICAGLVATETRAIVAAVAIAGVAMIWLLYGWRARAASASLLVAVALLGSLWFHSERNMGWIGRRDPGTDYRVLMWQDGLRLMREHPLTGIGMDTVEYRGNELNIRAYKKYPGFTSHFHSTPIQIGAECGMLALAAWLWLMASTLKFLWRLFRARSAGEWFERGLALGWLAAVAAFCGVAIVHYIWGDAEVMVLFWLLTGVTWAMAASTDALLKMNSPHVTNSIVVAEKAGNKS